MNQERLLKIVSTELTADVLKYQEDLELIINSEVSSKKKSKRIKKILTKIVNAEASIVKFESYLDASK